MGGGYQGMYNPATVETVTGTIESIDRTVPMKGMSRGVHLTLKTEKGPLSVHLGPEWYVERLDGKLAKGDAVEVKGSRVTFAGNPAIIAAEVKKGDAVLKLRDDNGIPAWAGWRREGRATGVPRSDEGLPCNDTRWNRSGRAPTLP